MEVDWSKAPSGAEFYACNCFWKSGEERGMFYWFTDGEWRKEVDGNEPNQYKDYKPHPKDWPATDERISAIAQNGGDGLHYDEQLDEPVPFQVWSKEFAKPPKTSAEYLSECLRVQTERGQQYDASGAGERSFKAAADAFNAATGKSLTGSDVCLLLAMVKLVRQYSSPNRLHQDSLLDGVSYMSLWAEELTKELGA